MRGTGQAASPVRFHRVVLTAAYELGIGETTVRQHLSGLYRRTGCVSAAQAAYWLGTGGLEGKTQISMRR